MGRKEGSTATDAEMVLGTASALLAAGARHES